jgi:hypothetical protein
MTTLERRLKKLEGRFELVGEVITHTIRFVDADGTLASTLTLSHGGNRHDSIWWHGTGLEATAAGGTP